MRIPFSYFLTPVFMFSLCVSGGIDILRAVFSFLIIHLLVYPASNGFNSYYDRDEQSIGGLEKPPPVTGDLLYTSLIFELAAVILALFISLPFAAGLIIYGAGSKSYSYDKIRFKRMPFISWLSVSVFGGGLMYILSYGSFNTAGFSGKILDPEILAPIIIITFYIMASYPLTQVYQHEEDRKRGDKTISLLLGIRGTFIVSAVFFIFALAGFMYYINRYSGAFQAVIFLLFQAPVIMYFIYWLIRVFMDEKAASFKPAMIMNLVSSSATNIFCIVFLIFYKK
jgi:4-hydroxybenzoate polyprenyltransferase